GHGGWRMSDVPVGRDTKWWGWGAPDHQPQIDARALKLLGAEIGELASWRRPESIEDLKLPAAEPLPGGIEAAVGAANLLAGHEDRVRHATGSGYVDLARRRSAHLADAPGAEGA